MSGGEAFVLDPAGEAGARFNADSVIGGAVIGDAAERLKGLVTRHAAETGSPLARRLIETWPDAVTRFRQVLPVKEGGAAVKARRA
jgi:glutamate synthase (NADPH/NADH) large chain